MNKSLIISRYNEEVLGNTGTFGLVSPVVGFDFYHYLVSYPFCKIENPANFFS